MPRSCEIIRGKWSKIYAQPGAVNNNTVYFIALYSQDNGQNQQVCNKGKHNPDMKEWLG